MKRNEIAIWLGAIAGVGLLLIVLLRSGDGSGNADIKPVYQISGVSPEVAAIRSGERIALINAKKDTTLGYLAYLLGINQSDRDVDIAAIDATAAVEISETQANLAQQIAIQQGLTAAQIARLNADAQKYMAQQAGKGKNTQAVGSIINNGLNAILRFFGK